MNDQTACQTIEPLLTACILGELPAETAAKVREHAAACPACGEEFRRLEATLGLLGGALAPRTVEEKAPVLEPERLETIRRNLLPPKRRLHVLLPEELRRHFRMSPADEDGGRPLPLGLLVLNVAAVFLVIGFLTALLLPFHHESPRVAAKPAAEPATGRQFEFPPKLDKEQAPADLASLFANARTTAERLTADAGDEAAEITVYPEGEYAADSNRHPPPAGTEIDALLRAGRTGARPLLIRGGARTLSDPWDARRQAVASPARGTVGNSGEMMGSIIPVRPISAAEEGMEVRTFPMPAGLFSETPTSDALRENLEAVGITFPAGAGLACEPAAGKVIVRNTPQNLRKIEKFFGRAAAEKDDK